MKVTFESEDILEIKQLAKSGDMVCFIFELVHNSWREFKGTDYDYEPYRQKILSMLEDYRIDIDDLID